MAAMLLLPRGPHRQGEGITSQGNILHVFCHSEATHYCGLFVISQAGPVVNADKREAVSARPNGRSEFTQSHTHSLT